MNVQEIKLHLQSRSEKAYDMVCQYLNHWRGSLMLEGKISYLDFRNMEDRLWLQLEANGWNGQADTLIAIAREIEKPYTQR